jgi:hypothetical protein
MLPVLEYDHGEGCSVTGGYVYRGSAIPGLVGHYFYSDYCAGWLRSFRYTGDGAAADIREWTIPNIGSVTSLGEDAAGELYILSGSGRVYRIEPAPPSVASRSTQRGEKDARPGTPRGG